MPKRVRNYANERARRDIKYRAQGYKSYNDYEHKRRNAKARSENFRSYSEKVRSRKTSEYTADELAKRLAARFRLTETDLDISSLDDILNEDFWEKFRTLYDKLG